MYTFKKASPEYYRNLCREYSCANICNVYSDCKAEKFSLFIGQTITLFGEPDYWTDNNEDIFGCVVSAEKEDKVLFLEIYYGASGPAIGGPRGEDYIQAANELTKLIMSAKPHDFDWKSTYEDFGTTIKMGVKNGKPYYDSGMPFEWFE